MIWNYIIQHKIRQINIFDAQQNGDEVRYEVDATKLTDCMDMVSESVTG